MSHAPLSRFLDIIETRSTFSSRHGQVSLPLEKLVIYCPDRKSNSPTEPDLQRIQHLDAAGITVSVLARIIRHGVQIMDGTMNGNTC